VFWRNTTEEVAVDLGGRVYKATHIDWYGMVFNPMGSFTGKTSLKPPAGIDSVVQLLVSA
jgi:hypothetical protein